MELLQPKVSIVMISIAGRKNLLRRALESWGSITYKNFDFTVVENGAGGGSEVFEVAGSFPFVSRFIQRKERIQGSTVWTQEGKRTTGDFVVFTMADEILGERDVIEQMLYHPQRIGRVSVNTFFMGAAQTESLDSIPYQRSPSILETYNGFWTHTEVENFSNEHRHNNGGLLSHITGATRSWWEWFGWFREDKFGYLNFDQDVVQREKVLGLPCVSVSKCYHQFHPPAPIPKEHRLGGHVYETYQQARLLEPTTMRT